MKHCTEDDLIAYQLAESPHAAAVRAHLNVCAACAAEAASLAETLRVFSGGPVPQPNLQHAWQRLRGNLPALAETTRPRRWRVWAWAVPALAACVVAGSLTMRHTGPMRPEVAGGIPLRGPGPLSAEPADPATAEHLSSAERLLTEVSHSDGALTGTTRTQAHELLLHNAVYLQQAQQRGDLPEAAVLETLGRTLTTLDHQPAETGKGWHLRLAMNTDGLLLDLRILQQNDAQDPAQRPGKDSQ